MSLPVYDKVTLKRYHFRSKWQEDEIKGLAEITPPDELEETLKTVKESQLNMVILKFRKTEKRKAMCVFTKVRGSDDPMKCHFYYSLEDMIVQRFNAGDDFILASVNKIIYLKYPDREEEIYPFKTYGLLMFRQMYYGIINTDPEIKHRYMFERVLENLEDWTDNPREFTYKSELPMVDIKRKVKNKPVNFKQVVYKRRPKDLNTQQEVEEHG